VPDLTHQNIANIINPNGKSDFVLICEHASCHIPEQYQDLGLTQDQIHTHIGWDIGAQGLSEKLALQLDAPLIVQTHSRLLYDCNRPPSSKTAVPSKSESTHIPGNSALSSQQKQARADAFYYPFHQSISEFLDTRAGKNTYIVTIHSFNPIYKGVERSLDMGIIHDLDTAWAEKLTLAAQSINDVQTLLNEPYSAADEVTHTLQLHGTNRSIPNVMIEIKNNVIDSSAGQQKYAGLLKQLLQHNPP